MIHQRSLIMEACLTDRETSASEFQIPADLWPGDAQKLRTELLQWLSEQTSHPFVELSTVDEEPSVSALQLLVAVTRRVGGPPAELGKTASDALSRLAEPLHMEMDA